MQKVVREYEGNVEILDYKTFEEDLKFQIGECSLIAEDYLLYKEENLGSLTEEEFHHAIFEDYIKSLNDGYSIEIMGDCYYLYNNNIENKEVKCCEMSNIKKALIERLNSMVSLTIREELVRECFDKFLKKEFNLENVKYSFKCCSIESDLIDIKFEDHHIEEEVGSEYALDSTLLELIIGQELGANENERICVYCPDIYSTKYIGIMLSPKLLIGDLIKK